MAQKGTGSKQRKKKASPARQSGGRRIEIGEGSGAEQQPKAMGKAAGK